MQFPTEFDKAVRNLIHAVRIDERAAMTDGVYDASTFTQVQEALETLHRARLAEIDTACKAVVQTR